MERNNDRRAEVVRAMDTLIGCINNENYIDSWLMVGVADGDIRKDTTNEEIAEMGYCDDDTFKDLMTLFLKSMDKAGRNGGLYCNGIVSAEKQVVWE